jgi:subfamily B ATP-binding cassette protein MsbA
MLKTLQRLYPYVRPYRTSLFLAIVCYAAAAATEPAIPALLKFMLDSGFDPKLPFPLWTVPVALIGLFFLRGVFGFSGQYLLNWTASKSVLGWRNDLVNALLRADASLYQRMTPGAAVSKVIGDPNNAFGQLSGALVTALRDGLTAIFMLGYLLYLNWQLTLLSMTTVPLLGYVTRRIHQRLKQTGSASYESQLRLVNVVDDIARAWRVVRTFDAAEFEKRRFAREAERLRSVTMKTVAASALMSPASQLVSSFGLAGILTLAIFQARQDAATVADFVAYITALLLMVSRIRHLTELTQPIISGLITAQGCFTLLDEPPEVDAGTLELTECKGEVTFEDVGVRYSSDTPAALDGLNLSVTAGQSAALVGSSGSGKTTLTNVILGFVEPQQGRVLIDGIDIREIRKTSLRRHCAVVSQDIVLFDGSLADNVIYAAPPDLARVEMCLKAANLWDYVQTQPDGLLTHIGTNGSKLSGGQRQRLAIARALYKNASIWILDEATSALDVESERVVQDSLAAMQQGRTLIVIAHRLSTVRNLDTIFVLGSGRLLEQGKHQELVAMGGVYAAMVRSQQS